jgi:hypothetical protein
MECVNTPPPNHTIHKENHMVYEIISLASNAKDISGETFGRLTAIAPVNRTPRGGIKWLCICKCSSESIVASGNLRSGSTQSCGCLAQDQLSAKQTTHGMSKHPLYITWISMKKRCYNKNYKYFKYYGGRGIRVCTYWKSSFPNFLADMGERPDGLTLDRIDNDSDYTPENCRWATRRMQSNNTRHNRFITHNGLTLTLAQWNRRLNGSTIVQDRIKNGWSEKRAVTEPVNR